ncbi:MAG: excinuclease ABC subunit C [Planctomycetes bacterium]|nr:excinuclease ABC subunit C [Planctomycetota bacterium]
MTIDGCPHTFAALATKVLPRLMEGMQKAIQSPHKMAEFATAGIGVKGLLQCLELAKDFSGCYVLLKGKGNKPFYVGISQCVIARLGQHVKGRTHFAASLAYQMACKQCPHKLTREEAMKQPKFLKAFDGARKALSGMQVAFLPIINPVELYLFEVYCVMELDTWKYNSFRTH